MKAANVMTEREFDGLRARLWAPGVWPRAVVLTEEAAREAEAARVLARDRHLAEFRALAVGEASR